MTCEHVLRSVVSFYVPPSVVMPPKKDLSAEARAHGSNTVPADPAADEFQQFDTAAAVLLIHVNDHTVLNTMYV